MVKVQGWVEAGNTTVVITGTGGTSTRKFQGSFPLATITVYLAGTLTLATIYSDNANPPTAKANPFTANSDGTWAFYTPNGSFDIKFSGANIPAPFTIGDVYAFSSSGAGIYNVQEYGAKNDGTTDDRTILNTLANTTIPAVGGIMQFPPGTYRIASTMSFPDNVQLWFIQGAKLTIDAGATVTINGPITSSPQFLFDGDGSVRFGNGPVSDIPLEWFGAVGDWDGATGTDNTDAIQKAVDSLPVVRASGETRSTNNPVPRLLVGTASYMWVGTLDFPDAQYVQFCGVNENISFLVHKPTVATTDGIKFRPTDAAYDYSNGFRDLSLVSASTNTRRLLSLDLQSDFILDHVKFESYPGAKADVLLYMTGMIASNFRSCEWNTAVSTLVEFALSGVSSTTVKFDGCRFEPGSGTPNGISITDAAGIVLDACVVESLPIGVLVTDDSDVTITDSWFEANDLAIQCTFSGAAFPTPVLMTANNQFTGQDQISSVLFDVDRVHWRSVNDTFNNFATAWTTTSKSIIQVVSNSRPRSTQYNWFTGAGQFSTSGMPMPVLGYVSKGNVNTDSNIFLREGGIHIATLTGDTAFHIRNDGGSDFPIGAQITLYLKQDGTGGRAASFGAAGTDYPVISAFTNIGNIANAVCMIELTFDGTSWIQTSYSPWFTASAGFLVTSASATRLRLRADGAAATPAINTVNFTTTGPFWSAGPIYSIAVNGVEVAQFLTAGMKSFNAAGSELFSVSNTESIFNESGGDRDFRIESDTLTSALHLDSGLFSGAGAWGLGITPNANVAYLIIESPTLTVPDNQSFAKVDILTDRVITVSGGTTSPVVASLRVREPTITVTGTVTLAATLYIDGPPTTGSTKHSIHVALGTINIQAGGSTTISTGVGSVRMSTANAATNTAWIPISYAGNTYYVPAWTTNAP